MGADPVWNEVLGHRITSLQIRTKSLPHSEMLSESTSKRNRCLLAEQASVIVKPADSRRLWVCIRLTVTGSPRPIPKLARSRLICLSILIKWPILAQHSLSTLMGRRVLAVVLGSTSPVRLTVPSLLACPVHLKPSATCLLFTSWQSLPRTQWAHVFVTVRTPSWENGEILGTLLDVLETVTRVIEDRVPGRCTYKTGPVSVCLPDPQPPLPTAGRSRRLGSAWNASEHRLGTGLGAGGGPVPALIYSLAPLFLLIMNCALEARLPPNVR